MISFGKKKKKNYKLPCRTDTCNGGSLSVTCWQSHYFMANVSLGAMTSSGPGQHLGLRRAASGELGGRRLPSLPDSIFCISPRTSVDAGRFVNTGRVVVFRLPSSVRRKLALTLPTPNRFRLAPSQPKSFTGPSITSVGAHTAFQTVPV